MFDVPRGAILSAGSGGHLKEAAYVCPLCSLRDKFRQLLQLVSPCGFNCTVPRPLRIGTCYLGVTPFPSAFFHLSNAMANSELFSLFTLAQAAPGGGGLGQFLPIILLFVGMWFLIIAPQRKRQKAHDQMLSELKSGDEIITSGGVYGTITNVKDDRFIVRIADNTKIELGKGFVASKVAAKEAE